MMLAAEDVVQSSAPASADARELLSKSATVPAHAAAHGRRRLRDTN